MESRALFDHRFRTKLAVALTALGASAVPSPCFAEEATESAWFRVTRDEPSASCPDAAALQEAVERLLDGPIESPAAPLSVTFSLERGRYLARLASTGPGSRTREFSDRHVDCAPLAQAVVTAIALYLESERKDPEPVVVVPRPEPPREAATEPAPAREEATGSPLGLAVGVGGGVLVGLGVPAAPAFSAELALDAPRLHFGLGVLWLPGASREVAPGYVTLELLAFDVRACFEFARTGRLGLQVCSGFFAGSQRAGAHGFTSDDSARQPWLAVPADLVLDWGKDPAPRWVGNWRLGLSLLVPTDRRTFSIAGLGTVIEPEAVAGWFWLTGGLGFGL